MKANIALMIVLLGFFLSGCASMVTTVKEQAAQPYEPKHTQENGVEYFLPKAVVKVVGTWDATSGLWDFTVTPVFGPDVDAGRYKAKRHENPLFDDDLTLAIDSNGLLQTVNGSTTDQSGNVVASLAATAATIYSFGASSAVSAATSGSKAMLTSTNILGDDDKNFKALIETNALSESGLKQLEDYVQTLQNYQETNTLSGYESNLLVAAMPVVDWYDVRNKARFSSFQSFLVPIVTNVLCKTTWDAPSMSVQQTNHSVYVVSTVTSGQAVYARFDMTLTAQSPVENPTFPNAYRSERALFSNKTNQYGGILVRDPIPYTLSITGHVWATYWITNSDSTNLPPAYISTFTVSTNGQQQTQTSPPFSYIWTYNADNIMRNLTNTFHSDERTYDAYEQTIMLPDASHTRLLPISRRTMVTDATKLTLVNGMVQSREDVRPSEVMGWVGIIKSTVSAVVPFFGSSGGGSGSSGSSQNGASGGSGGQSGSSQGAQAQQNASGQSTSAAQPVSPPIQ
jgi:hypothetical protein